MNDSRINVVDPQSAVIYLEVPAAQVVLLQAYFELYEGLGLVRTLDVRDSLVCIITTPSQEEECRMALDTLQAILEWRPAPVPDENKRLRYIGYFKNATDYSEV